MRRIFRFLTGILLIPLCVAATRTVSALVLMAQPPGDWIIPPTALAIGGGYFLWLLCFFTMPRPVRTYVLAHELTHALWAAMMGARVSKLKVTSTGGSVTVSKNNFLITLAPYFFPLYTALVILAYGIAGFFVQVDDYYLLWLGLVGFTWGFHFTFTVTTLLQRQSDIEEYGHVFSYAVIYLFNVAGIALWTVFVSSPTLEDMARCFSEFTVETAHQCYGLYILVREWLP